MKRRLGTTGRKIDQTVRPRRGVCPECGKRGLKLPTYDRFNNSGRECQYCLHWYPLIRQIEDKRRAAELAKQEPSAARDMLAQPWSSSEFVSLAGRASRSDS
jgi:hypothetical protein